MKIVRFDFKLGRAEGEVIKDNGKSVKVRFENHGAEIEIKRHKEKHRVEVAEET